MPQALYRVGGLPAPNGHSEKLWRRQGWRSGEPLPRMSLLSLHAPSLCPGLLTSLMVTLAYTGSLMGSKIYLDSLLKAMCSFLLSCPTGQETQAQRGLHLALS
jgi:hypothetical protein